MVVKIPRPGFRVYFLIIIFFLVLVGGGIYFYKDLQSKVEQCVYFDSRKPNDLYLFGQILSVSQEGNWTKTRLALCGRSVFPFNVFTLYSSVGMGYYKFGEKIQINGSTGYHWINRPIVTMRPTLESQRFVVFRSDILRSEAEIQSRFQEAQEFVCSESPFCADRISFFSDHGAQQLTTIGNLKNELLVPLLMDAIVSKSILFGLNFGPMSSLDEFRVLSRGSLL